jgi:excinuclease ABC subunit A
MSWTNFNNLYEEEMSKYLEVIWARTHNLKNVDVKIPKNKMTVITGLSGSWKSSLAFNTIYSVGQQKYLESLSSYARMFIGGMKEEAEVDEIKGLSPTISIDQKTTSKNPRSTVGTITEIFDYYKLLFLNVWERKCVKCETLVKKDSLSDVINHISWLWENEKYMILAPIKWPFKDFTEVKKELLELGFIRFYYEWKIYTINDEADFNDIEKIDIILDRLTVKDYSDSESADIKRLKDSLELAYKIGKGQISVYTMDNKQELFSNVFVCSWCGHVPAELTISSFSFNSHAWACRECQWLWVKKVFLEEKIINDKHTLLEWAVVAPWFGWDYFFALLWEIWKHNKINLNTPYNTLSKKEKDLVLYGTWDKKYNVKFTNEYWVENTYNSRFEWVINTLTRRFFEWGSEKSHYDDFVVDMDCHICDGHRLHTESLAVELQGLNIWELANLPVNKALEYFKNLKISATQQKMVQKVLKNWVERLEFLNGVWLSYMSISRKAGTLSGWEAQRIRLATQIGTKLEWIIYVLDEPSIGLHPRDNDMLIANLKKLRDIWNTLIIVEHDEDIMREADHIIDMWVWAWVHWWEIIAEWTMQEIIDNPKSVTGPFLHKDMNIVIDRPKRALNKKLIITWATQNNLKDIDVEIPLSHFVVVTWVSWSWKSSLVNDILANHLMNKLNRAKRQVWSVKNITGLENLDKAVVIDQSAIGKTPRSNPATYTGVFTPIREVFAQVSESQVRWYGPGRFSFNTKQGRCAACEWDGVKKIEMHFLPPVYIECAECHSKRYNTETLQIKYKGRTISDVLEMTIEEALDFFSSHPKIAKVLQVLDEVWLGYIKLGQSSVTLSWWEAQRIKLATELSKRSTTKTFYILDEPTTGLHFQDVQKLLNILHTLVNKWNTVLVIEHNMDVIMNADHIIDIWKEWGDAGWELLWTGIIEDIINIKESYTGDAIKKYLQQ